MRKEKVLEKSREMIREGEKPSVRSLSRELGFHPGDIHRLLNALEKEDKVETYSRELLGDRVRMVAVRRSEVEAGNESG